MSQIGDLVRNERDRLCIAYAYAYVEIAAASCRKSGKQAEALVIQPFRKVYFRSAAEVTARYANLQGASIPILFSPQHRSDDQFITHIGRLLKVVKADASGVVADVENGLKEGRYLLQSDEELVYSEGSFLFVHPRIDRLAKPVPISVLENVLGAGAGDSTQALHIPAPKVMTAEMRHLLDLAPDTWAPSDEWASSSPKWTKAAPCGKCRTMTPRDDLFSLNPRWWDQDNVQIRIRIRLCSGCFEEVTSTLMEMEWNPAELVTV